MIRQGLDLIGMQTEVVDLTEMAHLVEVLSGTTLLEMVLTEMVIEEVDLIEMLHHKVV